MAPIEFPASNDLTLLQNRLNAISHEGLSKLNSSQLESFIVECQKIQTDSFQELKTSRPNEPRKPMPRGLLNILLRTLSLVQESRMLQLRLDLLQAEADLILYDNDNGDHEMGESPPSSLFIDGSFKD